MGIYEQRFLSARERFEEKMTPIPWSGCWIWTERTDARGGTKLEYGQFWMNNKNMPAHRASWIIYKSAIPNGLLVCHKCDVPYCVNPEHLFVGSHAENTRDMINKGRAEPMRVTRRGESGNFSKLTEEQVRTILADNSNQYSIAKRYGISQACVSLIKRRKNWRHLSV